MKKHLLLTVLLIASLILPGLALAQPKVTIKITADKEIVTVENGQQVKRIVPADETIPGDKVRYTITYANEGSESAFKVAITDPVPEGTNYINGSAGGDGSDITFSIDGGKSYKKPSLLFYDAVAANGTKQEKIASPEEYTNVRWVVSEIQPNASGQCSYWVQVE
jgi:uncharacterized repeat protein (TIGR01451 family)